jgi:hypothetical protein
MAGRVLQLAADVGIFNRKQYTCQRGDPLQWPEICVGSGTRALRAPDQKEF